MRLFLVIMSLLPAMVLSKGSELQSISDLQSENRVVLIWSQSDLKTSLSALEGQIDDRDIIWFQFFNSTIATNYKGKLADGFRQEIYNEYFETGVEALLIGKDGGVKNTYTSLNMQAIFDVIDVMPMRMYEMQRKN